MMAADEIFSASLLMAKIRSPIAGRTANWSMEAIMRTEVMLSCPELLIEFVSVITVWNSIKMLERQRALLRTSSDLLRDTLPPSFTSSVGPSGCAETAGMASMLIVSIYISDYPWFRMALTACLGRASFSTYETLGRLHFLSATSKAMKVSGRRKREKVTGHRMMRLICRQVAA